MKALLILTALLLPTTSLADTVLIEPGQCVTVSQVQVCSKHPKFGSRPRSRVRIHDAVINSTGEVEQSLAYCRLSEGKSPNTWDLVKSLGSRVLIMRSFAHFEQDKCELSADRENSK